MTFTPPGTQRLNSLLTTWTHVGHAFQFLVKQLSTCINQVSLSTTPKTKVLNSWFIQWLPLVIMWFFNSIPARIFIPDGLEKLALNLKTQCYCFKRSKGRLQYYRDTWRVEKRKSWYKLSSNYQLILGIPMNVINLKCNCLSQRTYVHICIPHGHITMC